MIRFDEAVAIIAGAARPVASETIPLAESAGRVLAAPVIAAIDSPRANVSAMDGYAVRDADLASLPTRLQVVGESYPGAGWQGNLEANACVRLFTGAPLPAGADRVVIQEEAQRDGDKVTIDAFSASRWIRSRGRDFLTGDAIVPAGRTLDPAALIAAAGADVGDVHVFTRPRLALIATGDELVPPGQARNAALAIPDSVTPGLAAFAERWGAWIVSHDRLGDDLPGLTAAAAQAVERADIVLVTGGASVGERDFAKAMFEPLDLELLFSKISMRPGKPAWFGRVGDTLVLGLPGNPTSALVTARLLLAPLLAGLTGRSIEDALPWQRASLAASLPVCDVRETFHRATLANSEVTPLDFQESHAQRALAAADVLIRQPAKSPHVPAGASVQVLAL